MSVNLSKATFLNYFNFLILALTGMSLNFLIGMHYSPELLGYFWLMYALYVVTSHLCSGGLYFSLLHYLPTLKPDAQRRSYNATIILALITTFLVVIAFTVTTPFIASLLGGELHSDGLRILSIGLAVVGINKVFLGYLHGSGRLEEYALVQMFRNVVMILLLILMIVTEVDGVWLPLVLSISEVALFVMFLGHFVKDKLFHAGMPQIRYWLHRHFKFGIAGFLIPFLYDLNMKIDILILGFYLDESVVGVYGFAAMLYEGFIQLPTVAQTLINPTLSKLWLKRDIHSIQQLFIKSYRWCVPIVVLAMAFVFLILPYLLLILGLNEQYNQSVEVLLILLSGSLISAGGIPLAMLLNQVGLPHWYSVQLFCVIACNFLLNLMLIPILGIFGAAIATATASALSLLIFLLMTRRLTKIDFLSPWLFVNRGR